MVQILVIMITYLSKTMGTDKGMDIIMTIIKLFFDLTITNRGSRILI